jgi:hypothetical protein
LVFETAEELGDWLGPTRKRTSASMSPRTGARRSGIRGNKTGLSEIRDQLILEVTERGIPDSFGISALEAISRSGVGLLSTT